MSEVEKGKHIVICGSDEKVEQIIRCFREKTEIPIIVISQNPNMLTEDYPETFLIFGNPVEAEVLKEAKLSKAEKIIILLDHNEGKYADAKSIMVILAVKAIHESAYICVEALDENNIKSLLLSGASEVISIPSLNEKLLAQASLNPYVSYFYNELINSKDNKDRILRIKLPPEFVGRTFDDLAFHYIKQSIILTGVITDEVIDGKIIKNKIKINPPRNYFFKKNDEIFVIAK